MEENNYQFRAKTDEDNEWIEKIASQEWGSTKIISKDKIYNVLQLPGFVATRSGALIGVILYAIEGILCEVVALYSLMEKKGIGTKLIDLVRNAALEKNCKKIWLMTTNDNTNALRFYQKRGFVISAIRPNAMTKQRRVKPSIPVTGIDGIPIRDEIELEMDLKL